MEQNNISFPSRILSGIQPVQQVHIGHYMGAIKQHINLHHAHPGKVFIMIADYHGFIRKPQCKRFIENGVLEVAATYLALGLDPQKASLYRQSDIKEIFQIKEILSNFIGIGELSRLPTYKEACQDKTLGLLSYPILMAADILAVQANVIPVGKDQMPSLEVVKHIIKRVNCFYNESPFPIPQARLNDFHTVKGIDGQKMSVNYGNEIPIFEQFDVLKKRITKITTDNKKRADSKPIKDCLIFYFYQMFAPSYKVEELKKIYEVGNFGYEEVKKALAFEIQDYFEKYQEKYRYYKENPEVVYDVLLGGTHFVKQEAANTLDKLQYELGLATS